MRRAVRLLHLELQEEGMILFSNDHFSRLEYCFKKLPYSLLNQHSPEKADSHLKVELVAAAEVGHGLEHDGAEVEFDGRVRRRAPQQARVVADVPKEGGKGKCKVNHPMTKCQSAQTIINPCFSQTLNFSLDDPCRLCTIGSIITSFGWG